MSSLFIGNDSGIMHMAASAGAETIAIWGYTDYNRTAPMGIGQECLVLRKDVGCNPCYFGRKTNCLKDDPVCIKKIEVESVYAAATYLLNNSVDFHNKFVLSKQKIAENTFLVNLK
jgi:heptosyltransferase-2